MYVSKAMSEKTLMGISNLTFSTCSRYMMDCGTRSSSLRNHPVAVFHAAKALLVVVVLPTLPW
jgi:hypothetical protein